MGVATISKSGFMKHQADLLHPAVSNVWHREQVGLIAAMGSRRLIIGGDGRHNSMGHSAKYASYTSMELKEKKIVDIQLIQVGSYCNITLNRYTCFSVFAEQ